MQHPKGILIERSKQLGLGQPSFSTRNTGPEHEPLFESEVKIRGTIYGRGEGGTKRDAERRASEAALGVLEPPRQGGTVSRPASPAEVAREPDTSHYTDDYASDYSDDFSGDYADDYTDEPFSGPWPIFAEVLAASLSVAHARVNPTLTGPGAISEVQALALQLYKGMLENLGEIAELDDLDEPTRDPDTRTVAYTAADPDDAADLTETPADPVA